MQCMAPILVWVAALSVWTALVFWFQHPGNTPEAQPSEDHTDEDSLDQHVYGVGDLLDLSDVPSGCNLSAVLGAPFHTRVPMYYVNLNRSKARRDYMESTYSCTGRLSRVEGVDGSQEEKLLERLHTRGMPLSKYLDEARASPGEMALVVSHFLAWERALSDKAEVAVFFEDDVSPALAPYWEASLDAHLAAASRHDPGWEMLRLQYHFASLNSLRPALRKWASDPSTHFASGKFSCYGMVAYAMTRAAMTSMLERFRVPMDESSTQGVQQYDCLRRKHSEFACKTDLLFPKEMQSVLRSTPPLFTYRLIEGSTAKHGAGEDSTEPNRNVEPHMQSAVDALRWAALAKEHQESKGAADLMKYVKYRWVVKEVHIEEAKRAPVAESREAPVVESREAPVAESREAPVVESREVPVAESWEGPVADSREVPVVESREAPVADSREDPVVESREAPVAESGEVPVAESRDTPVAEFRAVPVTESAEMPVESKEVPVVKSVEDPVAESMKAPVADYVEAPVADGSPV